MLSQRLIDELNEQIKFEFYSSHLYQAAAAYCYSIDMDGFANFFMVQAEEERFHALRFFDFVKEMDANIVIKGLDTPPADFEGLLDLFERMLEHEHFVTDRIYLLTDIATEEREHATISFLKWFIDEQVEEMSTFKGFVQKLKRANNDPAVLYTIDDELKTRVFTPPTNV
ncbi:MAG: ferritin [Vallitaleaceae bacterium]|nr:ferritin [Vallitaleaceae bacterium]